MRTESAGASLRIVQWQKNTETHSRAYVKPNAWFIHASASTVVAVSEVIVLIRRRHLGTGTDEGKGKEE